MKNNDVDTVMAEMHAIKDANSARYGHDLKRMFAHWAELAARQPLERTVRQGIPGRRSVKNTKLTAPANRRVRALRKKAKA